MSETAHELLDIIRFIEGVAVRLHGHHTQAAVYRVIETDLGPSPYAIIILVPDPDTPGSLKAVANSIHNSRIKAAEKITGQSLNSFRFDLQKFPTFVKVMEKRETVRIPVRDIVAEYFPASMAGLIVKSLGFSDIMAVLTPICCGDSDEIKGIMAISSAAFTDDFLPSLRHLAQHLSLALDVARLATEHATIGDALQANEQHLRDLVDQAPVGIVTVNMQGEVTDANPQSLELLGSPGREATRGLNCLTLPSLVEAGFSEAFREVLETGNTVEITAWYTSIWGVRRYLRCRLVPKFDSTGKQVGSIQIIEDVTEQKMAEGELEKSRKAAELSARLSNAFLTSAPADLYMDVLRIILDTLESPFGFFSYVNEDGDLVSPSLTRAIWDQCEMPKKDIVFPKQHWAGLWGRSLIEKKSLFQNGGLKVPEGHVHLHNALAVPILFREELIGQVTLANRATDFTEADQELLENITDIIAPILEVILRNMREEGLRLQAETEREISIRRLEAKNAELERFIYTVSHDLKSPIITIKGFLGALASDLESGDRERQQEDLDYLQKAAGSLQEKLNDLLELSRIGRVVSPPTSLSISEIAEHAAVLVRGQIEARGVKVKIQSNLPMVRVDQRRVVEVFQNLLDNAVKFMGDQVKPLITIGAVEMDGMVICSVTDNGVGIARKQHERVFELFERLSDDVEGTGIGLALAKRIVEVHQGRIWVESAGSGSGSTFKFSLPVPSETKARPPG